MEAFSVLGSTFGTPSQSGVFSVLGSTFGTPSQSDLNAIAFQCNLLQLEETPTAFELPSVLGGTFSSPNITTDLSYFSSYNNVISDISLEQKSKESNSVVNFMIPKVDTTKEYSFEKAFEDSEVNTTSDFEISNSVPVKKYKNIKPRFGLRKCKISTAREDYFQDTFVSSSDESGITKNNKRYIKLKNNRKVCVYKDFQGACASSIDGSDICKNNEYSRKSKNSSLSNVQQEDFQADFAFSSVEESEVRKNSKCRGPKNRNKLNATKINFPTSSTSLIQSKVERNQQVDKTNPISEVALHKTNSKDEEKVSEIISISKLNSDSENDYQTNNEVEEEEKENVPEIISLSMINNSSEDSDDEYLANIASNKSLKSATLIPSNNSQIQLGINHGSNKRKESFQSNINKSIPQLELNSIEPKLDKTNLIPKPSFEAASISFDCATFNHIDYKEKKISETISTSKLNNDSENSEDDYQTNTEEEVSEIISLSKMHNSSEDSDDEYLANIASNKSLKSATLIASNNSQIQLESNHGSNKRKKSFQSNISKSIPQLELNSIEPKLDKTNLIPKPSFEAASISFDCATVNHIGYKEKKVSETILTSKLNNDFENSEDDYQTNTEEEVSQTISLSKMHNSSEDSDDEYLANIASNKISKSATLITSIISEGQSGSCHGRKKRSFQTSVMKSNPQLELNSTYNIVPFRESIEELTGSLNIDVYSEIIGSKNVSRRLMKHSAFRNLDKLNNLSTPNEILSTPFLPEFQWFTNNMNNSLISVPQSCKSHVDSAQTVTSLDEFPNQHSKETEETLNFIRELKEINYNSKRPLKNFNCIEIHNFAQNCPFSELRPKQNKKPTVPENEATSNQVLQKDKIKAAAKVLKPSLRKSTPLSRPKKWVTKRLYNFLFIKLLSNYGIRYRLEAQKLVMFMVEKVTEAVNKTEDYDVPVEELKVELARKKIIETNRDFFNFVREFLERDFYLKSVPNSRPTLKKQIISFTPGTIDDKILQS